MRHRDRISQRAAPPNPRADGTQIRLLYLGLVAGGIALTVYAIQQASTSSWISPPTVVTLVVGLALTVGFVALQLRRDDPLIDVRLLTRRVFLGHNLALRRGRAVRGSLVRPGRRPSARPGGVGRVHPWARAVGARPAAPQLLGAGARHDHHWSRYRAHDLAYQYGRLGRVDEADLAQGSGIMQTTRQIGGTLGVAIIRAVVLGYFHRGTQVAGPRNCSARPMR